MSVPSVLADYIVQQQRKTRHNIQNTCMIHISGIYQTICDVSHFCIITYRML